MSDLYAVMGNPIAHSKSPQIHAAFAAQTRQTMNYEARLVAEEGFKEALSDFFHSGGCGLNITLPFKQQACELAEVRSPRVELAGAANTLWRDDQGRLAADNTDGAGMVRDILHNHAGRIEGRRVLVLGAGGAVRGVLQPLLEQRPESLTIANRTAQRAEALAHDFATLGNLHGGGWDAVAGDQYDLVINGTSASLQGEVPPLPENLLARGAWCYDMMYTSGQTAFNQWALKHGAQKVMDGLGMLVEQAAESFLIWRGVRPQTTEIQADIRRLLKG